MDDPLADELRTYGTDTHVDRCDVLLDAAQDHLRNRRPERAIAIWQQLIREGGEDGDSARLDYAYHLFDERCDDEAWNELSAVMANGRIYSLAWLVAAEMLEERGELAAALLWYSQATDHLTVADVSGKYWIERLVTGRRRVKWALGIPLNPVDLMGAQGEDEAEDREAALRDLLGDPRVIEGRIQAWDRAEFDSDVRWRRVFIGESAEAYCRMVEKVLRTLDQRVTITTWTYGGFLDCLADARIRHDELPDGRRVVWPPSRNKPCWCGSGSKYKKCCGGPAALPELVAEAVPEVRGAIGRV